MFKTAWSYINNERGVETLEWIVVGALIVAIGIAIYPGTLQTQLTTAINAIGDNGHRLGELLNLLWVPCTIGCHHETSAKARQ